MLHILLGSILVFFGGFMFFIWAIEVAQVIYGGFLEHLTVAVYFIISFILLFLGISGFNQLITLWLK